MGSNVMALLDDKIYCGESIIEHLGQVTHIHGCAKLARKVRAELKFLARLKKSPSLKEDHLRSSNMDNLRAVCSALRSSKDIVSVLSSFRDPESAVPLVVDLVTEGGACWCKVVSRNPRALQRVSVGQGDFGQRSVLDQARRYRSCAAHNPHFFRTPRVRFVFSAGVGRSVFDQLIGCGVEVLGDVIDDVELGVVVAESDSDSDDSDCEESAEEDAVSSPSPCAVASVNLPAAFSTDECMINLDITAMLAYVSNLTNGFCHLHFRQPLLAQQAAWERQWPVKQQLDRLFVDRRLVCCRSAEQAFTSILQTVGGGLERLRAAELMRRVSVLDDVAPPFTLRLQARGKLKNRSAVIFGLGETLRVPTVTANTGFVRAAASQHVRLTVITHGSRALSERKQLPVDSPSADLLTSGSDPTAANCLQSAKKQLPVDSPSADLLTFGSDPTAANCLQSERKQLPVDSPSADQLTSDSDPTAANCLQSERKQLPVDSLPAAQCDHLAPHCDPAAGDCVRLRENSMCDTSALSEMPIGSNNAGN